MSKHNICEYYANLSSAPPQNQAVKDVLRFVHLFINLLFDSLIVLIQTLHQTIMIISEH